MTRKTWSSLFLFIFLVAGVAFFAWWRFFTGVDLVSVSTTGGYGNGFSTAPSISLNGRYVAFMSRATNLVEGYSLNPNFHQCYVRDIVSGTTEIVSISATGVPADDDCLTPQISQDGRYVVFESNSTVLDPNAEGRVRHGSAQIFLRDREAGTTTVISQPETITWVRNTEPSIVPDSRGVYYYNYRTTSTVGDPDFGRRLYYYNRATGATNVFNAGRGVDIEARHVDANRTGGWVAFESKAALEFAHRDGSTFPVVPDATTTKIYLYYYPTDTLFLVSNRHWYCYINGCEYQRYWVNPNGDSAYPSISPAGTMVAFETEASNLIAQTTVPGSGDRNDARDIYLFRQFRWSLHSEDELPGIPYIQRVSVSSDGEEGDGDSRSPSMGADKVAFSSLATNLVAGDTNGKSDIFLHDIETGETRLVSINLIYSDDGYGGIVPSINEAGTRVAFAVSGAHTYDKAGFGETGDGQVYVWRKGLEWRRMVSVLRARVGLGG